MTQAIQTQGLGRRFGAVTAVHGLDVEVRPGEIFGIVGPDGAGKTTTLRMLAGILAPTEGEAWVAGYSVRENPEAVKRRIAYMSQRFGLYGDLTVQENLRFYADLYEVPRAHLAEAEERLLGFSNLTPFRRRLARNLSGGMKQKLGLACALVHQPEVLLLDEPTNGVDPVSRRDFWRILYSMLKEGVTIFVSTAYLDEAERCSRVGLMHQGRLIRCDSPQRLKTGLAGVLAEFDVADPRRAHELLSADMAAGRASLYGGRLHLYADTAAEVDRAVSALTAAGLQGATWRQVTPTLEDVFIHTVGQMPDAGEAAIDG
ncbi:MAG: ABC transporter ATP-binding protein [Thiohalobacteraceae bacterium]|nr:ABC transporter ATP-binding protein [Gammaproteobacteria bacterium]